MLKAEEGGARKRNACTYLLCGTNWDFWIYAHGSPSSTVVSRLGEREPEAPTIDELVRKMKVVLRRGHRKLSSDVLKKIKEDIRLAPQKLIFMNSITFQTTEIPCYIRVKASSTSSLSGSTIGKGSKGTSQTPWTTYHKTLNIDLWEREREAWAFISCIWSEHHPLNTECPRGGTKLKIWIQIFFIHKGRVPYSY